MAIESFARLLKETMGLDVASVGAATLERAVAERQRAHGITDADRYWAYVTGSETELQSLIEAVIVPETWFFRDVEAFSALAGVVLSTWLRTHPDGVFRLLSLPCSSGEEPHSMAMALLDAGVPPERFRIDAIDISERVLAHGRRGVYGRTSFRGRDLGFRDRHFDSTPEGYRVAESVRRQVHFQQGNLLSPAFLSAAEPYDVIFCRNVLIYFDRETQSQAVTILSRLLGPEGFLFVGSSEPGVFLTHDFVSAKVPMAFAFRRETAVAKTDAVTCLPPSLVARRPRLSPPPARPSRTRPAAVRSAAVGETRQKSSIDGGTRSSDGLEQARRLADQGRFVEAARCCNEELQQQGPSADAFYLLGLVRDASGNHAEAGRYYRKALYLEPNHSEALMHLALMMEGQGEHSDARVLRGRLKRLEQQGEA